VKWVMDCHKRAESPRLAIIMRITVVCSIEDEVLWHRVWGNQREGLQVLGRIQEPTSQVNTRRIPTQSFGNWPIINAQRLQKMESKFYNLIDLVPLCTAIKFSYKGVDPVGVLSF